MAGARHLFLALIACACVGNARRKVGRETSTVMSDAVKGSTEENLTESSQLAAVASPETGARGDDGRDHCLGQCVAQCVAGDGPPGGNMSAKSTTTGAGKKGLGVGAAEQSPAAPDSFKEVFDMIARTGRRREVACRRRRRETDCSMSNDTCGRRRVASVISGIRNVTSMYFHYKVNKTKSWLHEKMPWMPGLGASSPYTGTHVGALLERGGRSVAELGCWPIECVQNLLNAAKASMAEVGKRLSSLKDQLVAQASEWKKKLEDQAAAAKKSLTNAISVAKDAVVNQIKEWYNQAVAALQPYIDKLVKPVNDFVLALKKLGSDIMKIPQVLLQMFNVIGSIFSDLQKMGGIYGKEVSSFFSNLESDWSKFLDPKPQIKSAQEVMDVIQKLMDDFLALAKSAKFMFQIFDDISGVFTTLGSLILNILQVALEGLADLQTTIVGKGAGLIDDAVRYEEQFNETIPGELACIEGIWQPLATDCVLEAKGPCDTVITSFDADDIFDSLQRADHAYDLAAQKLDSFKDWLLDSVQTYVSPVIDKMQQAINWVFERIGKWVGDLSQDIVNMFKNIFQTYRASSFLDTEEISVDIKASMLSSLDPDIRKFVTGSTATESA